MSSYQYVTYETLDDGRIARIMLNRVESRNAQSRGLLVELDEAFLEAEADDEVRVVILGGAGTMLSSSHDLGSKEAREEWPGMPNVTALLIKESVNQTVDNMGFQNGLAACFSLHQLNHAHWAAIHDDKMPAAMPEDGVSSWRDALPTVLAEKSSVRAER